MTSNKKPTVAVSVHLVLPKEWVKYIDRHGSPHSGVFKSAGVGKGRERVRRKEKKKGREMEGEKGKRKKEKGWRKYHFYLGFSVQETRWLNGRNKTRGKKNGSDRGSIKSETHTKRITAGTQR